jgi:anti-sigma factor RsiW
MRQALDHLHPEELSAFIDGELPPEESQAIQQHLARCHECALDALSATQLKAATARAGQRFAPPPDTLARLAAQLQPKPAKKAGRVPWFGPVAWVALAAGLLLAVSIAGWQQIHNANNLSAELLDQHLATLSSSASPEVVSTDRHTVKPWFQGKLPFSFNLPDSTALPSGAALKGADLAYLNGQPAALLLFTIDKHEVSIFLTQQAGGPGLMALPRARAGFAIHTATTRDLRIVAVSDVNPADLDRLVSVLVEAQSPG